MPFYGTVFSSSGDDTVRTLAPEFGRKTILVGEKEESDIQVFNIKSDILRTKFSVRQNNYNDLQSKMLNIISSDNKKLGKENKEFINSVLNKEKLLYIFDEVTKDK